MTAGEAEREARAEDEYDVPGEVLRRVSALRAAQQAADVEILLLACDWGDRHPALDDEPHAAADRRADAEARLHEQRRIAAGWLAGKETGLPSDYSWDANRAMPEDPWIPLVDWRAFAPFAAAMGLTTVSGERWIKEGLFLRHRMPRLWARVLAGQVAVWRARRIVQSGWRQPADVVEALDTEVTPRAHAIGVTALERLIDELMLRLHPEERELDQVAAREEWHVTLRPDPTPSGAAEITIRADYVDAADFDRACAEIAEIIRVRQAADGMVPEPLGVRRASAIGILADPLRASAMLSGTDRPGAVEDGTDPERPLAPGVVLFVHITDQVLWGRDPVAQAAVAGARGTAGPLRPQLAQAVAQWCGRPASSLRVHPVIDLNDHASSEAESPTSGLRIRAALRRPTCTFPWCERPARSCDADHCVPAAQDGPTCDCNLQPLCRRHHRLKTFGGWSYTPLETAPPPDGAAEPGADMHPPGHHPGAAVSWLWRSPHGMHFLVDDLGTIDVTPPHTA